MDPESAEIDVSIVTVEEHTDFVRDRAFSRSSLDYRDSVVSVFFEQITEPVIPEATTASTGAS